MTGAARVLSMMKFGSANATATGGERRADGASSSAAASGPDPLEVDICVIGAGAAGLALAAGAVAFGQRTVLIEKHRVGGPSASAGAVGLYALAAAASQAHAARNLDRFGLAAELQPPDHAAVLARVRDVVASQAPNVSSERFAGLGVRVVAGAARFLDAQTVEAGETRVRARRFVIATGSSPRIPAIPGLETVGYLTADTLFDVRRKVDRLTIVGSDAVSLGLAQAFARLGSRVTVLANGQLLAGEDSEQVELLLAMLSAEGIAFRDGAAIERVETLPGFVRAHVRSAQGSEIFDGSHFLICAGRQPNTADLNLSAAGIVSDAKGTLQIDKHLRTTNKRVFAIGDATAVSQRVDSARDQAEAVLRHILFRVPASSDARRIARVTCTAPEIARVGLTEAEARSAKFKVNVLRWPLHENDRAQAEQATSGHVKVVTDPAGRILGASILGIQAGEMIQVWALAVAQKITIKAMTKWTPPYPTRGEANRRAAERAFVTVPSSPFVRKLIARLSRLG